MIKFTDCLFGDAGDCRSAKEVDTEVLLTDRMRVSLSPYGPGELS